MTDREQEAAALIHRFDRMRDSGICSPTTRALLDDAEALILAAHRPTEPMSGNEWTPGMQIVRPSPTEPDEDVREALAKAFFDAAYAYDNAYKRADDFLARFHVTPHGAEPDEDNWEYGTVSEITPAQVINVGHVDYWLSRGYDIVRRRRASEWEPVTPRGEKP